MRIKIKTTLKIIPVLIFFVVTSLHAQYGLKAGINIPNVSVNYNYVEPENKIGFDIGILLDIAKIEGIHLTSTLTYSKKSISGRFGYDQSSPGQTDISVDYLIYSLSGKYNFLNQKEDVNPYISFAPRLNIYLSNSYTGGSGGEAPPLEVIQDFISDKITKFGLGISIGAGFDVKTTSPVSPFFEIQFSPDFFDSYDDGFLRFRSNSIEAMLGIRIN